MGKRVTMGVLIALIVSIWWGILFGPGKISKMEDSIEMALQDAGYADFAKVRMVGNAAILSGTPPNDAAASDAINVAKETKCTFCRKKDRRWHVVKDEFDRSGAQAPSADVTSPYTLNAQLNEAGEVTLTGFVPNEDDKQRLTSEAQSLYGDKLVSTDVMVANGAPDDNWTQVAIANMTSLSAFQSGQLEMRDNAVLLSGTAADAAMRDDVLAKAQSFPAIYDFKDNIIVDQQPAPAPQIESVSECQTLFNSLQQSETILFETSKANIKGDASFDLLNRVADAAKRCQSFKISVEGHTDSVGSEDSNLTLSKSRADEVVNYLGQNGVSLSNLTAQGFGETQPVADNNTAEGRSKNRRIQFTITQSQ